jgi:hypothetical protein
MSREGKSGVKVKHAGSGFSEKYPSVASARYSDRGEVSLCLSVMSLSVGAYIVGLLRSRSLYPTAAHVPDTTHAKILTQNIGMLSQQFISRSAVSRRSGSRFASSSPAYVRVQ